MSNNIFEVACESGRLFCASYRKEAKQNNKHPCEGCPSSEELKVKYSDEEVESRNKDGRILNCQYKMGRRFLNSCQSF